LVENLVIVHSPSGRSKKFVAAICANFLNKPRTLISRQYDERIRRSAPS
jgi:hypothetical protein